MRVCRTRPIDLLAAVMWGAVADLPSHRLASVTSALGLGITNAAYAGGGGRV